MKVSFAKNSEKILTTQDIDTFETKINGKLPESYKQFMLTNNGGVIEDIYYCNYYISEDNFVEIYEFFPLEEIINVDLGELAEGDSVPENWIPIANDGNSGVFFLSIKGDDFGKIYFCEPVHDIISVDSILVSENFEHLINHIERDREISDIQYLAEIMDFNKIKELIESNEININYKDKNNNFLFNLVIKQTPPKNEWNKVEYMGKFNEACELIKYLYNNGLNIEEIELITNFDVVMFLLSLGYDINQKNKFGETQLMYWAKRGSIMWVEFLLKNGADKYIKNKKGKKAYDYAVEGSIKNKTETDKFDKIKEILK